MPCEGSDVGKLKDGASKAGSEAISSERSLLTIRRRKIAILKTIAISVIGVAAAGTAGFFALGLSSQSGSAPGLVDGRLSPCPDSPNCVSSEAGTSADKSVEPLPASAWDDIPSAVEEMGGRVKTREQDYLAAEFRSQLFGFVDDVEFRKGNNAVHIRSASRVGYSDGGVNAARVAELRELLTE